MVQWLVGWLVDWSKGNGLIIMKGKIEIGIVERMDKDCSNAIIYLSRWFLVSTCLGNGTDIGEIGNYLLGVFSLTGTRFTTLDCIQGEGRVYNEVDVTLITENLPGQIQGGRGGSFTLYTLFDDEPNDLTLNIFTHKHTHTIHTFESIANQTFTYTWREFMLKTGCGHCCKVSDYFFRVFRLAGSRFTTDDTSHMIMN